MESPEHAAATLAAGHMLAHYQVEAKIGEGGMGAVYRAHDTKLRRKVALKVLAPERFSDLERKRRLLREARAASSLNHPNIVTIYEIGSDGEVDFISMEYVEGKRLDELIPSHGLTTKLVLRYAVQIADALAKAHGAAILHRDLKPSNIMVTEDGRVKVLDFGLARMMEPPDSPGESTATMWTMTEEGTVIGTAAYMSPEQAQGRKLDARSDIFSFGTVLYEMSTGRRPFAGDSRLTLLSNIVNEDPVPPGQLAPLPLEVERVILRCLRKDLARRYQTMADLKVALEDLETETASRPPQPSGVPKPITPPASGPVTPPMIQAPAPARGMPVWKIAIAAAAVLGVAAMAFFATRTVPRSPEVASERTVKFIITPKNLVRGSDTDIDAEVSVSRDGKHIAYVENPGGQLWIRDLDQEDAHVVPGATGVYQAFWSPDNHYIGYEARQVCGNGGCDLVRIPVEGGTPSLITKLQGAFKRASWSSDGETVVYCDSTGMYTVPTTSGPATLILAHPHIEHPSFLDLPGGRHAFLYQAVDPPQRGHGIYVQVVGESQRRLLLVSSSSNPYPAYSPTGHIIYVDGQFSSAAIWAVPFSLEKLQTTGKPFLIAQHGSSPMVSRTGTLVYSDVPTDLQQLGSVDRSGGNFSPIGEPQRQAMPLLSPDGRKLAIIAADATPDIFIHDLARGVKTRFTNDADGEVLGAWTPSGGELTYSSNRGGNEDIFSKSVAGNSDATVLVSTPLPERAPDWSPDGRFLMYVAVSPDTKGDLLYRERQKDGSLGDPTVFLNTPFSEVRPRFSSDGHFVAYVSDESGRNEVYVRDFPSGANKVQVSANGGVAPRWRRDGKELFYVEGRKLMTVSFTVKKQVFSPGAPAGLFERRSLQNMDPQYDVSTDGKRFYVLDRPPGEKPLSIHVVHNWFEEFRSQQRE